MSKEVVDALTRGEITPAQFWLRHISPWTLIADATLIPEVDETYRELADSAAFMADSLAVLA